jgi:hypothetical protein
MSNGLLRLRTQCSTECQFFAVHNRTYGVLGDLFECILQRTFDLFTEETRVCYEYVKAYCTHPEVKKVVWIAHSQGCIKASQILDQLYVDLPAEAVFPNWR